MCVGGCRCGCVHAPTRAHYFMGMQEYTCSHRVIYETLPFHDNYFGWFILNKTYYVLS